jgi:cell wall-associated NlpC family hydrolase
VQVFETTPERWAWVQLAADRYVGWMRCNALSEPGPSPTHKVAALRTIVFSEPDIKSPAVASLPLGACVTVNDTAEDRNARYALIPGLGAVVEQHLACRDQVVPDFVSVAERFLGAPYLWGGKTSFGLDCSGLVQIALEAAGILAPRDTDMQETALGNPLPTEALTELGRGDLVFWKGHVGIMRDAISLLHANAHHMAVAVEPLADAAERIGRRSGGITSLKRLA